MDEEKAVVPGRVTVLDVRRVFESGMRVPFLKLRRSIELYWTVRVLEMVRMESICQGAEAIL